MEITIFSKKTESKDGRKYNRHFARINDEFYDVRFVADKGCNEPAKCPCNIVVQPGEVSVKVRKLTEGNHAGETFKTLYVYKYTEGTPFVDTSADYLFEGEQK